MSITERMENDGLSFQDAAAKEGLLASAPRPDTLRLLDRLRNNYPDIDQTALRHDAGVTIVELMVAVAERDKRFAEHLAAWKANNQHHARRIEELEDAIRTANEDLKCGEGVDLLYYLGAYVREDQKEQRAKVRATLEALLK